MIELADLLNVVLVGLLAGVGLTAAFSLLIAESIRATAARRRGTGAAAVLHGVLACALGLACAVAVAVGVAVMLAG